MSEVGAGLPVLTRSVENLPLSKNPVNPVLL